MGRKLMDLTGDRYGRLTVINEGESIPTKTNRKIRQWVCLCDCGSTTIVRHGNLRGGSIKSCGCEQNTRQDFIGEKYGRLTIIAESEDIRFSSISVKRVFICECECGVILKVRHDAMASGNTSSCGCYKRDATIASNKLNKTTHGLEYHPLYSTWSDMNRRCYNENTKSFEYYGGRGIKVCDEWRDTPTSFIEWGEGQHNWYDGCGLTLDRIDVNGDYEPDNCRFATYSVQAYNRRVSSNNTSGYRGVYKKGNAWGASITVNGKLVYLGRYKTLELAAESRQLKELELFGHLLPDTKIATEKVKKEIEKISRY